MLSIYPLIWIMTWTVAHFTFAVQTFFKTAETNSCTEICAHFMFYQNDAVQERKLILLQVESQVH